MTFSIITKTIEGDFTNFVLSDGNTTTFTSYPNNVTDEQVMQELDDHAASLIQMKEEERRIQAEIEANLNG